MVWGGGGLQLLADTFYSTGVGNKRRFAQQINAIIMAERGNKVVSGCVPIVGGITNLPTAGTHLIIGSGTVLVGGVKLTFAGANIDLKSVHDALGVGQARYILITIYDSAGTATARATAGSVVVDGQQEPPTYPKDEVAIALIYLEESTVTMTLSLIGELFMLTPSGSYVGGDGELTGSLDLSGHDLATIGLKLAGAIVTASAAELNLLDGKAFGIADTNIIVINHASVVDNDYAKFTVSGLEGRSFAEVRTDLGLVIGTNVLAEQTIGIADNNLVEIDSASATSGEYTKLTANGLESKSFAEIKTDLGLEFGTISNTPAINQSLLTSSVALFEGLEVNQPSGFAGANVEIRNTSGVTWGMEIWDDAASGIFDVNVIRLRAAGHTVAQLTTSDDWIVFEGSDGQAGAIEGGVVYTTFTGAHNLQSDSYDKKTWKQGMIVISTGEVLTNNDVFSMALVKVQLANNNSDKRVIGVFSGAKDLLAVRNKRLKDGLEIYNKKRKVKYSNLKDQKLKTYTPMLGIIGHDPNKHSLGINALGEGRILVCDKNGIIQNGDYITSSDILGYGIKQNDDGLHNYTVAKITQYINWDDIIPDQNDGIKKILVTCTYHCG